MEKELKCKVCGAPANGDRHFVKSKMLCRRHNEQMKKYGKIISVDYYSYKKECDICNCTDSSHYYVWHQDDEYNGKTLCNRHYLQLKNHGKLLDFNNISVIERSYWTAEEKTQLEELYKEGKSFNDISSIMNRSIGSINAMSSELRLGDKYIRPNNPNFKAVYQDYDWCFERYINRGMSHQEMADECKSSLRVVQKWCSEIHCIDAHTFRTLKKLTNKQKELIMFGTLGDGHIDKRETQPMYIESHAKDEKEYVYWKYGILKDVCNNEPKYYPESYTSFGTEKQYLCQPFYRLNTRILDDLYDIRNMTRLDKINELNEFGLSTHMLDDASRGNLWELCLAEYSQEEIDTYINICSKRFRLKAKQCKDKRYILFDAVSSKMIDEIILKNIPNNLDIITKKILGNNNIKELSKAIYIITQNKRIGLNTYCRENKLPYLNTRNTLEKASVSQINEIDLLNLLKGDEI